MFVTVKWNGLDWFTERNGVRHDSILSPNLFTAFMNIFILSIRNRDLGCYVNRSLVSCICTLIMLFYYLPSRLQFLCVGDITLNWCSTVKYLGVHFVSGKHLNIDFDVVKRKYFSACNC